MKYINFISIIMIMSCSIQITFAEENTDDKGLNPCNLIFKTCDTTKKSNRIYIAKRLLKDAQCLDTMIPNLKPSEIEWLEKEGKAIAKMKDSGNRFMNFYNSSEYQTREIKDELKILIFSLSLLANQIQPISIEKEMMVWGWISHDLVGSDFSDPLMLLRKKLIRIYGENYDNCGISLLPTYSDNPWVLHKIIGRNILGFIILRYLKGDITK